MTRARYRWWPFGIVLLSLIASRQVFAVSPSYIVFYGDQLAPVVLRTTPQQTSEFLWSYSRAFKLVDGVRKRAIPDGLEKRRYVKYAVFWGRWTDAPLKPEAASQHGRLYLPTATEPAAVVVTFPDMDAPPPAEHPGAHPIPADLIGFWGGWVLTPDDVAAARALGVPGL